MDLFNKEKVTQLQNELVIEKEKTITAKLQFDELKRSVNHLYDDLTDYFNSKYKNVYLKTQHLSEEQIKFKCEKCAFIGGYVIFDVFVFDGKDEVKQKLTYDLTQVSLLKQINKKEYKGENK